MGVAVAAPVAELAHQPRGGVAQVQRHLQRAVAARVLHRLAEGHVGRVALGHAGEVDHGLGDGELALGAAEALVGLPGVEGDAQRTRVGVADVLARHAHHAPGDVEGVAAAVEHAREPVQGRVRVGAAHGLVQRRDLVVEQVAALVEAPHVGDRHLRQHRLADAPPAALVRLGEVGGDLEQVEGAARVAVRGLGDALQRRAVGLHPPAQAALGVGEGPLEHGEQRLAPERAQDVGAHAREQRVVELEGRVLRGGADEDHLARLHVRQEGVLLRLVEAVRLVDEEHRRASPGRAHPAGALDGGADVLHAREHRRKAQELRVAVARHDARERGLAGAGRAPQHHGVQVAGLQRAPQRRPRPEQVLLAHHLVQAARAHAVGQRPVVGRRRVHVEAALRLCHHSSAPGPGPASRTTSTPGGGVKRNSAAASGGLRSTASKRSRTVCP